MKRRFQIRLVGLICCCLFLFVNAYSQKDSTICVKIDDIGMYAPRGENAKPPYKYPSTAIAFQYNGKSFYLPVMEDNLLPQFGINIKDTALLTLKTFKNRTGYYGEKPMVGISNIQRMRSTGVHDTLCRLISFSDTIYVTNADAHWTVERYRHACYGISEEKLSQPLWILHVKGDLCSKLSTLVCQRADYYERGNRRRIPMKRLKTKVNPAVDLTLEEAGCQLLFQFED